MAYDNRFTSIKPIIEAVYRDSAIEEINFESAMEDAAELVGLIGIPYTYIDKNTNGEDAELLFVENHRAYLPQDLAYLVSMRKVNLSPSGVVEESEVNLLDGGNASLMQTDSIDCGGATTISIDIIDGSNSSVVITEIITEIQQFKIASTEEMIETSSQFHYTTQTNPSSLNYNYPSVPYPDMSLEDDELIIKDGYLVGESPNYSGKQIHTYRVNNNVIFTSFKDGYIDVAYKAYPTDSDGLLMVPDDEKFRAALKYHLIYKIDWRKWRTNPASPGLKALLNDSEMRRDWYVGAARNKSHIPTVDKMESIKNMTLRQVPRLNEHKNGFLTLNIQERRRR